MVEKVTPLGISLLIHGPSKSGKSTLFDTAPAPRLHLDVEGGSGTRFTKSKKTMWNPLKTAPPDAKGLETCVVHVRDYQTVKRAYEWLNSGKHPFKSVAIDSISETQQRAIDSIAGVDPMQIQQWGELLREVDKIIRDFRDLLNHPTKPLDVVMYVAMTTQTDGKWRPYVQGQLADRLPYRVDICGYQFTQKDEAGKKWFRLLVDQHAEYEAGERVGGILGEEGVIDFPNISKILNQVRKAEQGGTA